MSNGRSYGKRSFKRLINILDMGTLVLSAREVEKSIEMSAVISAVEDAFREHGKRNVIMPPKVYLDLPEGDFRAMPVWMKGKAGVKWVCAYPENPKRNLPSVMGIFIYSDSTTGYPLAVMDATVITKYRTGAASGIASRYLARKDSTSLGLVGCGVQASTQVLGIEEIFNLDLIKVYDPSEHAIASLKKALPEHNIEKCSIEEAVRSDIVSTLTPVRVPIVRREWVARGTHINAVGADAPGKEELDPQILLDAKVVVDDMEQAKHGGEINVPLRKGTFSADKIYATLGEIVAGKKKGRESNEITVFDSTGLAIQDIAVAEIVFKTAKKKRIGIEIDFVD